MYKYLRKISVNPAESFGSGDIVLVYNGLGDTERTPEVKLRDCVRSVVLYTEDPKDIEIFCEELTKFSKFLGDYYNRLIHREDGKETLLLDKLSTNLTINVKVNSIDSYMTFANEYKKLLLHVMKDVNGDIFEVYLNKVNILKEELTKYVNFILADINR